MKISFENNRITINEISKLKKYQISQLEYYGFTETQETLQKLSENVELDLKKITSFFYEENIEINLSSSIQNIIQRIKKNKKELITKFETARQVKNGIIKEKSFFEFKKFLTSLPRKLKEHQIRAAYHLYLLENGANFSVPGSGKTSVVLSVYEKLRNEGRCNTLFVIGPSSCFQPWKNEFLATLNRKLNAIILSGNNRTNRVSEYYKSLEDSFELYLTTFQTVLNDSFHIEQFLSQKGIDLFLVIDEAHYIKQIGGTWANSLLNLSKYSIFKCVLTGTPIPKSYKDIFNLFDFLWGANSPLEETDKINIAMWEKSKKNENVGQLLEEKIGPLFYRVQKKDLGLKPAKFHEPIIVKMNQVESYIYKYISSRIIDLSMDDFFKNEEVLNKLWKGRMIRLRQAVSNPKLLITAIDEYIEKFVDDSDLILKIQNYDLLEIPGKLSVLNDLVLELRKDNKKIVIWSNFIDTLKLIKSHFMSIGENCELIFGKTPIRKDDEININEEKTREDIRDEFIDENSGLDILIANPAACAESISLHKTCFNAVYYDLSYNCAHYLQSLDRIHRVGGSEINEANYYFLLYENSIDMDIKNNLELKAKKMYEIIEKDYAIYNLDLYDDTLDEDIESYKRLFLKKMRIEK